MQVRIKDEVYNIYYVYPDNPELWLNGHLSLGVSDHKNKNIFIDKTLDPYDQETTLAHELFHCLMQESGVENGYLFHNEDSVNFLGMSFKDIIKMFKDVGFIEEC